jgi:hypothetical protein
MLGITTAQKPSGINKEDLFIVFTHNQNGQFLRHTTDHINSDTATVLYLNIANEFNHKKTAAFNELISQFHRAMAIATYQCVTFVMDFNLGYSTLNICPIQQIITTLDSDARNEANYCKNLFLPEEDIEVSNYTFITDTQSMAAAQARGKIPFRFILTGSGGERAPAQTDGLENLTIDEARDQYSYMKWQFNKFLGSLRNSGCSPSSVTLTPRARTRRLDGSTPLRRDNSVSSTASEKSNSPSPTFLPSPTHQETNPSASLTSIFSQTFRSPVSLNQFLDAEQAEASIASPFASPPALTAATRSYSDNRRQPENGNSLTVNLTTFSNVSSSTQTFFNDENKTPKTPHNISPERNKRPTKIVTPDRKGLTKRN